MANNELQFQGELIRDINRAGGHAFKMSSTYKVGVADLYVRLPAALKWEGLEDYVGFIETKFTRNFSKLLIVGITELQKKFLKREQDAGGMSAWLLCVKVDERGRAPYWIAYGSRDLEVKTASIFEIKELGVIREVGKPWDVYKIIELLERP